MIYKKTLYEWCVENQRQDILDLWDYDLNEKTPKDISASDIRKYFFICPEHKHPSEEKQINSITKNNFKIKCYQCCSFGNWCLENNRKDLLKRWDNELNGCTPFEVPAFSKRLCYFKCPKGLHPSELKNLSNIIRQYGSGICHQCNSIGQYGIDNIDKDFLTKYWSSKNKKSPFDISKLSHEKIWIKCQMTNYHEDYASSACDFYRGTRCPYCASKLIDKNHDSLGAKFPKMLPLWSIKNKDTPYDYFPLSNKKAWWKCENEVHEDYLRKISDSNKKEFRCPKCMKLREESILQEKVRIYLEGLGYRIKHEYGCNIIAINPENNYKLPYDNELEELKLIIEVNGQQHYHSNSYNKFYKNLQESKTPQEMLEHRIYLDKLKKDFAINNGYHFLEIPYWTDNKKETWKYLIDSKIKSIEGVS